MRNILAISISIVLLSSCGSDKGQAVEEKIAERDSLEALSAEITGQIISLNQEIAKLDTNLSKHKHQNYVEVMEVKLDSFADIVEVQGVVEAKKNVLIAPEMAATIRSIHVDEGDWVKKGQKLISLDGEAIRKTIKEIKTALDLAEKVYERQNNLWKENIGSEIQLLEAENRVKSLKDKLSTMNTQLQKATIVAPDNGYIEEIVPKEGEMAAPGMPVIRLINLDHISVKGDISERYIGKVKKGDPVSIKLPSLEKVIESKISRVGRYINPNNRTFTIEAMVVKPPAELKPNLLTVMEVVSMKMDSAILVPSTYVMADGSGRSFVYLTENSRAKKVWVTTGSAENNMTVITGGVSEGDMIITKGARTITDGEELKIVTE